MADRNDSTASASASQEPTGNPGRKETGANTEPRSFDDPGAPDRNAAGLSDVEGDLGAGTPANVDLHKLGQEDKPQEDWGEPADPEAVFSSYHTRRAERTEAERGQGQKTRTKNKNIVSRRS